MRSLGKQGGLSLQQLAEQADVSAAAIHKIEQSGMLPTITTLLKVAGALGKPVAFFVDEEEPLSLTAHTPDGEQLVYVLEGELEFVVGGKQYLLGARDALRPQ